MKIAAQARNSITGAQALDEGRKSLRKPEWCAAFTELSGADREAPLEPDDLEGVSRAAYLIGREAESADFLARAHQGFLGKGDTLRAARCASWLAFVSLIKGDAAQAGGWLARADRLLNGQMECVEKGYRLLPVGLRSVRAGDAAKAENGPCVREVAVGGQAAFGPGDQLQDRPGNDRPPLSYEAVEGGLE